MHSSAFAVKALLAFIFLTAALLGTHCLVNRTGTPVASLKVHILLASASLIVVGTLSAMSALDKGAAVGYAFLGFVVFKMFVIGYLAVCVPEFNAALIPHFILFWTYLAAEAVVAVMLVKQNKI